MVQVRSTFKNFGHLLAGHANYSVSGAALKKRSGFEVAGFFILLALILLAAASLGSSKSQATVHKSGQSAPAAIDLKSTSQTNNNVVDSAAPAQSSNSNSVSTNVTSNSDASGKVNTSVTVNGQPVSVPQNGSTHQTVGNAQVNISHSSTTSGSATTTYVSNTSTNVDSSSDVNIDTGGN